MIEMVVSVAPLLEAPELAHFLLLVYFLEFVGEAVLAFFHAV